MADKEQLDILKQGVTIWNAWRKEHDDIVRPDLRGANLYKVDLRGANLLRADLEKANLQEADLSFAELNLADLRGANLEDALLSCADLSAADLRHALLKHTFFTGAFLLQADLRYTRLIDSIFEETNLSDADLSDADLTGAFLNGANLNSAKLDRTNFHTATVAWTLFADVDLSTAKGLETVIHEGPSTVGINTLLNSGGHISEIFLRRSGVPDTFIEYARSLISNPINYYTCFISYSSKDRVFAERLYNDLQGKGVLCWFAPKDLKIGDKFWHKIDESIRLYDKLLVVISKNSVASTWVENEVMAALEKESRQNKPVLFPIMLDKTVIHTVAPWAANMRRMRHIGDFTKWKDHDGYQQAFTRLLRDLNVS